MTTDYTLYVYAFFFAPAVAYMVYHWWSTRKRGHSYFISYYHRTELKDEVREGHGTASVTVSGPIDSHEKIVALERGIKEAENLDHVQIIYWRRYD